ncbi:MAG: hypothetical protein IKR74_05120 [Bacilli bacterium]|nr:hypothetical protein [Bacilli bacterium]
MEKQYSPSLEENINAIYELLYLPNLDNTMNEMLSMYLNAYNQTIQEYNSNPTDEVKKRLDLLYGPINYVLKNFPDDDNPVPFPAVDIIKKNFWKQSVAQNNAYSRALKPNIPNILPDDSSYKINGFSYAIIIVIITILLGIGLGTLLWFIK